MKLRGMIFTRSETHVSVLIPIKSAARMADVLGNVGDWLDAADADALGMTAGQVRAAGEDVEALVKGLQP